MDLKHYTVSSGAFSIGIKFEYWKKYSSAKEKSDKKEIREDYVERKYDNFKEEMLNYKSLGIHEYNQEISPKVTYYLKTNIVKSMETSHRGFEKIYSIPENTAIGFNNLASIVMITSGFNSKI